jgi:hypothetical protein
MLVITRHRPGSGQDVAALGAQGDAALEALSARPGFVRGWCAVAADEPDLVLLATEWVDVGSWRRAMSPVDVRMVVLPFMTTAVDEPTAFLAQHVAGDAIHDGAV